MPLREHEAATPAPALRPAVTPGGRATSCRAALPGPVRRHPRMGRASLGTRDAASEPPLREHSDQSRGTDARRGQEAQAPPRARACQSRTRRRRTAPPTRSSRPTDDSHLRSGASLRAPRMGGPPRVSALGPLPDANAAAWCGQCAGTPAGSHRTPTGSHRTPAGPRRLPQDPRRLLPSAHASERRVQRRLWVSHYTCVDCSNLDGEHRIFVIKRDQ